MHGKKHIHRQQIKCTVTEGSLPTFIAELKQREVNGLEWGNLLYGFVSAVQLISARVFPFLRHDRRQVSCSSLEVQSEIA